MSKEQKDFPWWPIIVALIIPIVIVGFIYGYDTLNVYDTDALIKKIKSIEKQPDIFDDLDALNQA